MNNNLAGEVLDALFMAKRTLGHMPPLQQGIKPAHIRVLHAFIKQPSGNDVRVSDISESLQLTKPSVTKLIQELVDLKAISKQSSPDDKRVIFLKLLPYGRELVEKYVIAYHAALKKELLKLPESDYQNLQTTIRHIYQSMLKVEKQFKETNHEK